MIDPALFRFEVADGVTINDRREASTVWGPPDWVARPMPVSLSQASREATFDIMLPTALPDGFERESIEHYWEDEIARQSQSHADWVRLRYASPTGDWLVIEQGFGGYLTDIAGAHLVGIPRGTARVGDTDAQWVDGLPLAGWEPGVLMMLSIESSHVGGGWAIGLDGGRLFESPFSVLLATNRLTLAAPCSHAPTARPLEGHPAGAATGTLDAGDRQAARDLPRHRQQLRPGQRRAWTPDRRRRHPPTEAAGLTKSLLSCTDKIAARRQSEHASRSR